MPNSREDRQFQATVAREAPRIDFARFVRAIEWKRSEHFGLIGPTGGGKTNMMISLQELHPFVTVFATKPKDRTMDALIARGGYYRMERWQGGLSPRDYPRRVLWPNAMEIDAEATQKEVFGDALRKIYREGGWTVAFDELFYMSDVLQLKRLVKTFYTQARSLDISVLAATQRPANVPLEMYDQSDHLMFWRTTDKRSLDRIEEINYGNTGLIRQIVARLEKYQVLYVNTRTGAMYRTRAPLHSAISEGGEHTA